MKPANVVKNITPHLAPNSIFETESTRRPEAQLKTARISSIETGRVIAIVAVVCMHLQPFYQFGFLGELLEQVFRGAVPFFFVTSGYFLHFEYCKPDSHLSSMILKTTRHLLGIYLAWNLVYFLFPLFRPDVVNQFFNGNIEAALTAHMMDFSSDFLKAPMSYFFRGTQFHLWFLPALWIAVCFVAISHFLKIRAFFSVLAVGLFITALLSSPYKETSVGLSFDFNMRNGPFFSTIFVFSGYLIAKYSLDQRCSRLIALTIAAIGFCIQIGEALYLEERFGYTLYSHNYLAGTLFYGVGLTLLLFKFPQFGERTKLYLLGRYALGVYLAHVLVGGMFFYYLNLYLVHGLWGFPLVLITTFLLVMLLKKVPIIKRYL